MLVACLLPWIVDCDPVDDYQNITYVRPAVHSPRNHISDGFDCLCFFYSISVFIHDVYSSFYFIINDLYCNDDA
jgi:hypothetical protein